MDRKKIIKNLLNGNQTSENFKKKLYEIISNLNSNSNHTKKINDFIKELQQIHSEKLTHIIKIKELLNNVKTHSKKDVANALYQFIKNLPEHNLENKVKNFLDVLTQSISQTSIDMQNNEKDSIKNHPTPNSANTLEEKLYSYVLEGNKDSIEPLLDEAITNYNAGEILNQFMIPAITKVGELYDKKEYFLPQLMQSAETMKKGTAYLEPYLKQEMSSYKGIITIATVKGDIHDIGKNIVAIILENYGFKVYDLGKDIPKETILEKSIELNADIITLSALMTTTMIEMEYFMKYMTDRGHHFPVMIGGAVVNENYAKEIGAYYSEDAIGASQLATKIINLKKK